MKLFRVTWRSESKRGESEGIYMEMEGPACVKFFWLPWQEVCPAPPPLHTEKKNKKNWDTPSSSSPPFSSPQNVQVSFWVKCDDKWSRLKIRSAGAWSPLTPSQTETQTCVHTHTHTAPTISSPIFMICEVESDGRSVRGDNHDGGGSETDTGMQDWSVAPPTLPGGCSGRGGT